MRIICINLKTGGFILLLPFSVEKPYLKVISSSQESRWTTFLTLCRSCIDPEAPLANTPGGESCGGGVGQSKFLYLIVSYYVLNFKTNFQPGKITLAKDTPHHVVLRLQFNQPLTKYEIPMPQCSPIV